MSAITDMFELFQWVCLCSNCVCNNSCFNGCIHVAIASASTDMFELFQWVCSCGTCLFDKIEILKAS